MRDNAIAQMKRLLPAPGPEPEGEPKGEPEGESSGHQRHASAASLIMGEDEGEGATLGLGPSSATEVRGILRDRCTQYCLHLFAGHSQAPCRGACGSQP